ncbi:Ig-like domain-containing protein [Pseudomonas guariconensis]|uniref:Ig-like domain-containing protein n=1 Tax=Pseudomonas guariconensis TaxID=1288410 RepID=UPI003F92BD59
MSFAMNGNIDSSTRGHNLVQADSFPLGSISEFAESEATVWKAHNSRYSHYEDSSGMPYVGLTYDQQLWQIIELPVQAAVEGRPEYWLGCEYDATAFEECWLRVYDADEDGKGHFYEGVMQGKPLELIQPIDEAPSVIPAKPDATWHVLSERRIAIPEGVRRLRVQFETPENKGPYLYLRKVTSHLRLPMFNDASELQLLVERPGDDPIVQAERPFLLCHGATHRLQVKVPAGDAWEAQKTSLLWMGTDQLPIEYGLEAEPGFNRGGDEEDRYQPLSSTDGACWRLTADATLAEGDLPPDIPLGLGSYWQAEKHPIAAQIGDFHHIIEEIRWDFIVPVVGENSTTLTAIVKNPFAPDRPVVGQEVIWSYRGKQHVSQTDANGHATLTYIPELGDAGEANQVIFAAQCKDALQHTSSAERTLPVFDESPWLKQVEVTLDGKPIADLSALALRLTRGTRHTLTLKPTSAESYFVGKDIALSWPDESKLGITLEPKADVAQRMGEDGVSWTIEGGTGISGLFSLYAKEVAEAGLKVPLSLLGVQLSTDLHDEAVLKLGEGEPVSPTIFRREMAQKIGFAIRPGSPLKELGLEFWLDFDVSGTLAEADVHAVPDYRKRFTDLSAPAWSLTGQNASGIFGVQVHMEGFTTPLKLSNALLLSLDLNDEVEMTVDGSAQTDSITFRRKVPQTISFKPKKNSPISQSKLKYWLAFDDSGSLSSQQVGSVPNYGNQFSGHTNPAWTVTGTDVSGTFGLQLHMEGFTTPVKRGLWLLLSQKVEDEFDLLLEGSPATEVGYFWRGQPQRVTLKPKDTSPLSAGTALKSRLQFRDAQSLPVSKLVANPDYGVLRPIPVDGNEWTLTGASDTSGRFGLEVWVEDFDTPRVLSTAVLMSSHLDDEVDYTLSGSDISEPPIFRRNVGRTISLKPKAGSPLTQLDLVARLSFNDGGTLKQTDMNAVPGYGQPTTVAKGLNWTLTGTDVSGVFGVTVTMERFQTPFVLGTCGLLSTRLEDDVSNGQRTGVFIKRGVKNPRGAEATYPADSPLITLGAKLSLKITDSTTGLVTAVPSEGKPADMNATGVTSWALTGASSKSGQGMANIHCSLYPDSFIKANLFFVHMPDIADEVEISWKGVVIPRAKWTENAFEITAKAEKLSFRFKNFKGDPLGLKIERLTSDATVTCNPGVSSSVPASKGYWEIKGATDRKRTCSMQISVTYNSTTIGGLGGFTLWSSVMP